MRVFIAVELTEEIKENLSQLIKELEKEEAKPSEAPKERRRVKWVEKENLHVTLKFLGKTENIEEVIEKTEKAVKGSGNFNLNLKSVGNFGTRVVWVGTEEGKDNLKNIAEKLEILPCLPAGRGKEERPFSGHLTIGRIKGGQAGKLLDKLNEYKNKDFGKMMVDKISIIESKPLRTGPVYKTIKEVYL